MAKHAFGTTFTWNGQVVAGLTSINGGEATVASVDKSTHQSSGAITESVPGMITIGDVTISGYFDESDTNGQLAMKTDQLARTTRTALITFPAAFGTTFGGSGYITSLKIGDAGIDNIVPFTATVKPTGVWTLSVTASTGLTTPFMAISESAVIAPALAGSTYTYVATVLTAVESVTVTPTASAGVITVNGNVVATGEASSAIVLGAAGSVTPITIVVTETNKAAKTYTIYLTRAAT
jgi:hypothetical protein